MKFHKLPYLIFATIAVLFSACKDETTEVSPTVVSSISGLVLTVNNEDYVAVPKIETNGLLGDTLLLKVDEPGNQATVKQISFADEGVTSDIKTESVLNFTNNLSTVTTQLSTGVQKTYVVKMIPRIIPYMYLVKTSDKNGDGNKYFLNTSIAQKIYSSNADDLYEGYIDLSSTNWDNLGIVHSNLQTYYDVNGGWWPEQTAGSFTLTMNTKTGSADNLFPSNGPWADWNFTNGNPAIVSPGYWKFNFNKGSGQLTLLETQWSVSGSATGGTDKLPMVYNSVSKKWTITTNLTSGDLNFTTIPVMDSDPVVNYGEVNPVKPKLRLSPTGSAIKISIAGNYTIQLDLSNSPYYKYKVTKN